MEDDRLKAAVALGFGLTQEKSAEFAGVSVSTIKRWCDDPEMQRVTSIVSAAKATDLAAVATKAAIPAGDRIRAIFEKSTTLTERAIAKVEALGDEATLAELMDMHNKITVWAAKFSASEAPKRVSVEGSHEVTHRHILSLSEATQIIYRRREVESNHLTMPRQTLIEGETPIIDVG